MSSFQKGNLHTHSTESDGDSAPEDVYAWYRDHGYNFLGLSDHNRRTDPADYASLATPTFVMIPAEEVTMTGGGRPVHVNALCHQHKIGGKKFATVGEALSWGVARILEQGGAALVNHPNYKWAFGLEALPYARGAQLLEIWSGHPSVNTNGDAARPSHEAIWDAATTAGMLFAGAAVDDMHKLHGTERQSGPGRGFVDVFARSANVPEICDGLRRGRLVASNGPRLSRLVVKGDRISLSTGATPATVEFIGVGGKVLATQKIEESSTMASYELRGGEGYVRARVTTTAGKHAWTQAYLVVPDAR